MNIRCSCPAARCAGLLTMMLAALSCNAVEGADERRHLRMLEKISADFRDTAALTGIGHMSDAVAAAMRSVPRHEFVTDRERARAYANHPLPIGYGQTISQPFIVALMTELAMPSRGSRVLEIGTGSGYQAAVLAEITEQVYSIEIIPELAEHARIRLARLGYDNIHLRVGNGQTGWPQAAPFDVIVVTAGGALPRALLAQLAPGGRLIIPLDNAAGHQTLTVIQRSREGSYSERAILPVRFVPLADE